MSRNKRGGGADEFYSNHLGRSFSNNPTANRVAAIERMYQRILTELAVNRFKWYNMPESVDLRFMEMTLFYNALSVFYFDKDFNQYFALKGGGINWVNMMDNPVGFSVIGNNFVGKNLSASKESTHGGIAVPIWSNYMRIPDLDIVRIYSQRFAELDRTIEINSLNARQSKVLVSGENQQLSVANIDRQIQEGSNNISVNGPMQDLAFIQALDLGVDSDSHEKLHILKVRQWNECMGYLGIDNANQDKKERLVAGEADANNDQTSLMRFVNLNARKMGAELINKTYPELTLDSGGIRVEYNTEIEKQAKAIFNNMLAVEVAEAGSDPESESEEVE